jgi:hypothetical protein
MITEYGRPKDTAGLTFGTNGFRLKFADNSSNAALGTDTSGVSPANTWTVNNLSGIGACVKPNSKARDCDVVTWTGTWRRSEHIGRVRRSSQILFGLKPVMQVIIMFFLTQFVAQVVPRCFFLTIHLLKAVVLDRKELYMGT